MRITANVDRALDDLVSVRARLKDVYRIMRDSTPVPAAQSFDGEGGGSVAWCEFHEQEVRTCHRGDLVDLFGNPCEGVSLADRPDPTGDAASGEHTVFSDERDLQRHAAQLAHHAQELMRITGFWVKKDQDTTEAEDDELEQENRPKCERHLRYGYDLPARGKSRTRVKHKGVEILRDELWLCEWCEKNIRSRYSASGDRSVPTEHEIHHHAKRVGVKPLKAAA